MRARALLTAIVGCAVLAGCGGQTAGHRHTLQVDGVPLIGGARVVASVRSCDRGAHSYCALQLVVAGARFGSSKGFLDGEAARLHALHWTSTNGDTPKQRSADSPGHRLRLSYALASDDLMSWDVGQIRRRPQIARALAHVLFRGTPALSLMLQTGSS